MSRPSLETTIVGRVTRRTGTRIVGLSCFAAAAPPPRAITAIPSRVGISLGSIVSQMPGKIETLYVSVPLLSFLPAASQHHRLRSRRLHRVGAGGGAGSVRANLAALDCALRGKARAADRLVHAAAGRASCRAPAVAAAPPSNPLAGRLRRIQPSARRRHAAALPPGESGASAAPVLRDLLCPPGADL